MIQDNAAARGMKPRPTNAEFLRQHPAEFLDAVSDLACYADPDYHHPRFNRINECYREEYLAELVALFAPVLGETEIGAYITDRIHQDLNLRRDDPWRDESKIDRAWERENLTGEK